MSDSHQQFATEVVEGNKQMSVQALKNLYDYGYWANRKLFAVIAQLAPEQFTQPIAGSYGSIRNTLVHMMSAEAGWLERCGGPSRGPRLNPDDFPTVLSVIKPWETLEANLRRFLGKLNDEDLVRDIEFSIDSPEQHSLPLGELMQHAAIHGIHHRGQLALLLRHLGHAPGDFDILFYYAEKSGGSIQASP